jgi:hypothetical protein
MVGVLGFFLFKLGFGCGVNGIGNSCFEITCAFVWWSESESKNESETSSFLMRMTRTEEEWELCDLWSCLCFPILIFKLENGAVVWQLWLPFGKCEGRIDAYS